MHLPELALLTRTMGGGAGRPGIRVDLRDREVQKREGDIGPKPGAEPWIVAVGPRLAERALKVAELDNYVPLIQQGKGASQLLGSAA